jgi:hypothetical protein
MSRENVLAHLDNIRDMRIAQVPLTARIPVYLQTAAELVVTPGVRSKSLDFVGLAGKASATVIFQSAVAQLEKMEPSIIQAIDNTGQYIVDGLNNLRKPS